MAMKRQSTATSFVPAIHHARPPATLTDIPAPNVIDVVRQGHASAQNLQEDTALVAAQATLLVSLAYLAAIGLIVTGIAVLAWIFQAMGERIAVYAFTGLVGFGLAALASLLWNRRQSLWYSPPGLGHHEIASRERIATEALNVHADLLLERWQLEAGKVDGNEPFDV